MRIAGAKKVHYDSGPNMTPLVDVVMVILIFLMLCGSFAGAEQYLASNLPLRDKGGKADPTVKKPAFEDIQVDIRVDHDPANLNAWKARFGDIVTGDSDRLKEALQAKFNTFKAAGNGADKLQVIINPNSLVKWKSLIAVYQAANDAGFTKIAFSSAH
jgi:biopolymer transport protein ExbD